MAYQFLREAIHLQFTFRRSKLILGNKILFSLVKIPDTTLAQSHSIGCQRNQMTRKTQGVQMAKPNLIALVAMCVAVSTLTLSAAQADEAPKTAGELKLAKCEKIGRDTLYWDKEVKLLTGIVNSPGNAMSDQLDALKHQLKETQQHVASLKADWNNNGCS
ncbi:MAG: hypothetical protein P8J20_12985 [Novosphingobium sp.]|nr:hypothetical protein [Novosphingobium sp.]